MPERPKYPIELVNMYGAKAGILLYVAQQLPEIPQARMLVNEPGETVDEFAARVSKSGLRQDLLIRSSAVAELDGYEGILPTVGVSFPSRRELINTITRVRYSPKGFKEKGRYFELPDEISTIAAEKSPSKYVGTMVKHPNQDGVFIVTIAGVRSVNTGFGWNDRASGVYSEESGRIRPFGKSGLGKPLEELVKEIGIVVGWHHVISSLAEMDSSWTYQLEFGLEPNFLYQVRPFKKVEKANFSLPPIAEDEDNPHMVIGITTAEGINLQPKQWSAPYAMAEYFYAEEEYREARLSLLLCSPLRDAAWLAEIPNIQGYFLDNAHGVFQHDDVRLMRQAQITVLAPRYIPVEYGVSTDQPVNLVSDGWTLRVTKLSLR